MCNSAISLAIPHAQRKIFKPKKLEFLLKAKMCLLRNSLKRIFSLLYLLACSLWPLYSQQLIQQHYLIKPESKVNQNLLQTSILGIQPDANGELWLASSFGLLHTDGIETRILLRKNYPTLGSDRHKSLYRRRDNHGILLMDAYGGMISIDHDGRMQKKRLHPDSAFVGYAGQAWKINRRDWRLPDAVKSDIVADQIAYNGEQLTAIGINNTWYYAPNMESEAQLDHPVIARNGFYQFDFSRNKLRLTGPQGSIQRTINDTPYFVWLSDTLIAFTSGKGLFVCDLISGTLRIVQDLHPYRKGEIYCALPVSRNSFMLGTYDHGLLRLSFTPATLLNANTTKPGKEIFIYSYAIFQDTQLLIPGGGLNLIDTMGSYVNTILLKPSIGHPIFTDSRGIVWLSDKNGIIACRMHDRVIKRFRSNNERWDLFFELNGKLYASNAEWIYHVDFDKGRIEMVTRVNGALGFFNVRKDGEDLWLLSENGAYKIDRHFRVKAHILQSVAVRDAIKIGNTWTWATYGRGILQGLNPDPNASPAFDDPHDWSLAAISLRYDPISSKLWLVCNRAIFILSCDKNGELRGFYNILECGIHLPARELNGGNYPENSVNNLPYYFFPSSQGLLKVPRNIHAQISGDKLRLIVSISGKDTLNDAVSLRLSPGYSFLSIRVKVNQPFVAEGKLSYRISGAIPDWKPLPENQTIGPFKLPPGEYLLELRSLNGVIKTLQIHVPPYWYNTLWFRVSFIACVVILALVWLKVRTEKLVQRKAELTFQVNQRTHELRTALLDLEASRRELTEAYETREKMNAVLLHDIRSPLMFLTESAYHFNRRVRAEAPQYFPTFNLFAGTIKDLYLLATDFNLWFKLPLDSRLRVKTHRVADLIDDVVRFYQPIIESGANTFTTDILVGLPELQIQTHAGIFKSILRNLLDNSNKYTPGGSIHLHVGRSGESLLIRVNDTGSGLPDEIIRIYGTQSEDGNEWLLKETAADEIGLNLILRFTRMLNGRLVYRHHHTQGSLFTLELPLQA